MKCSMFAVGLTLVFGAVLLVSVQGGKGGTPHKWKCLDKDLELKDYYKGFIECASVVMPDDVKIFKDPNTTEEKKKELGIKAHKNMCLRVCQWKKHQHLLMEDGSLNKTGQAHMIDTIFPEAAREGLKTGITKCHEESSKSFKDDNNCESYKPFEACIGKTFLEVCKVDAKQFHMDGM